MGLGEGEKRRSGRVLLATVLALPFLLQTGDPAAANTVSLTADADAFVLSTKPAAKKGHLNVLRLRQGQKVSYVRFLVPDSAIPASGATLRMYATSASKCSTGVEVLRAGNDTWVESSITWANQPGPTGSALANLKWSGSGFRDFDVSGAVTAAGPVSFLLRHAQGCSVTSDTVMHSREATTNQPQLLVETTSTPACADGTDNDGDGLADHPADPGCTDANDVDETDQVAACADGLDNDVDGTIDFPNDPGCSGAADDDELHVATTPAGAIRVTAAGDIVCAPTAGNYLGANPAYCQHRATADLLVGSDAVLPLGDLQYESGTLAAFTEAYDPSWGQQASTTYPAVGNHEYKTAGAQGYHDYWASKLRPTGGPGAGYYSFDLGSWHIVSLNSVCAQVPCIEGTAQNDWLEVDLAATTKPCIAAYWHHPYFNSGTGHGSSLPGGAKAFLNDLYAAGADVVLNGHEHNYQRYAKQDPNGASTPSGFRSFVVGSGGASLSGMFDAKDPNYELGNTSDFGVLRLHLGADSYTWEFVGVGGTVLDAGGPVACN